MRLTKYWKSDLPDTVEVADLDPETYKSELNRVYRKLDLYLIPPLWIVYFLTSADRSNVGLALTMNSSTGDSIIQHLDLTSRDLSLALAFFYVGYLVFDAPFNLIMTKIAPHAWMSRIVISIGIVASCMAACNSGWSFILVRTLLGVTEAGMWPGMAYYMTLWYPAKRCARRIGFYFTAAQISASVVGLVSAGFQLMNGARGLTGYQWMFLIYGVLTVLSGVLILFWLPDRPRFDRHGTSFLNSNSKFLRVWKRITRRYLLSGLDADLHMTDMRYTYSGEGKQWTWKDVWNIIIDPFLWPLIIMYFGVVGVGIGVQNFATIILRTINPQWSSITLSLLTAPIWLADLIGILIFTPISDRFSKYRYCFFIFSSLIIIAGLFVTTYAGPEWGRYAGLLVVGFGLGPTVPITMAWTAEIFGHRHKEVGQALATALVSGLGNLGSVTTTYALYTGWPADAARQYKYSNMVMVGMLGASILSALLVRFLLKVLKRDAFMYEDPADNLQQHNVTQEQNVAADKF
ncbi:hypothetical protein CANCADRAFT_1420 [Tortispora caseinolytica NRRL Y-17796]|uniref:Major facilitator superfamily (MFS) profile domain-containing protein n=1 Tax=Tortispora caseinolytica NRRL Y-17796 TaxID=767744 RepID=A0A1E4TM33_9ASCO|nr:hypothetical protein CANCADRAFT_1420 [Tortispora caseinolytica NRRL Y-17796]